MSCNIDLMSIISKRRNELISDILVKCNVMEAAGTGFEKIVREYKDAGNTHRPFIYSKSDHFTLVLPDLTYEGGISESSLPVLEYIPIENGSIYDNKILSFCYYSPRKSSEIATFLGITDSSYLRSRMLNNLVEQSYLLSEKINGTTYFKTNPETTILK